MSGAAHSAPLLVVITGPTGSGKSEFALELATQLEVSGPAEIISVDSALVYRGMNIGTAKPSPEVRARYPHHLIDIRDPTESYSAGEFVSDALSAITAIHARGAVALLVGGTMLYQRALYHGLAPLPAASPLLRAAIDGEAQAVGWPALHAALERVDPEAAARIAPNDGQRIQRALEVYRLTGTPISRWQRATAPRAAQFQWLRYALLPSSREELRTRIEQRLQRMLEMGFIEEVEQLYQRGDLTAEHPSMRAVGYRQFWQLFSAGVTREQAEQQALHATLQLAKRQLTWLRRERQLITLPSAAVGRVGGIAAQILAKLSHDRPQRG